MAGNGLRPEMNLKLKKPARGPIYTKAEELGHE